MLSFGSKIVELRKEKKVSQEKLAEFLKTSKSVVGKYERDETIPSIEVAKRLAKILDTTVSYLLDDSAAFDVLKNDNMMQRIRELSNLPSDDQDKIMFAFDGLLRDAKARMTYSKSS